jgi:hypothetical protein
MGRERGDSPDRAKALLKPRLHQSAFSKKETKGSGPYENEYLYRG